MIRRVLLALLGVIGIVVATGCSGLLGLGRHTVMVPSAAAGIVTATGHGWTAAGIQGPIPAPGRCHYQHTAGGELLPDPRCTPGAIDTAVHAGTLRSTVCRPGGYTASVRPPEAITEAAKRILMAAYGIPWSQASHYELDHLLSGVAAAPMPDSLGLVSSGMPLTTLTWCGAAA